MQPPSSSRKPAGSKDDSDRDDDALVKPAATGKPKPSSTKSGTKSTAKAASAGSTRASTTRPAPKPSAAAPAASAPKPPMSDDPDIFKPAPPRPVTSAPKPANTSASGKPQGADRVVNLGRTLATRNLEIARRWGASAGSAARNQAQKLGKRASSVDVNKPLNRFAQGTGKFAQRSGAMLDQSTGKLQKQLETSDSAVLVTTLILVAACVILTALVVLLAVQR